MKSFLALALLIMLLPLAVLAVACGGGDEEEPEAAAVVQTETAPASEPSPTPKVTPTPTAVAAPTTAPTWTPLPSTPAAAQKPISVGSGARLALISATCTLKSDIGFTECEGFVENISGKTMENVEVVITWADDNGVAQSSDEALIDYNPILAGQQSPWSTIGTYNPALTRFRVQFKELIGGTIPYRDDRPQ